MSLKKLCLNSIAQSIIDSPPIIQEIIIDNTKKDIEKKVINELTEKIEQVLPWLIDQILDDIIDSLTIVRTIPVNYYFIYSHIDKRIISTAIKSAKLIFKKMTDISNIRNIRNNGRSLVNMNIIDDYEEDYDEDYDKHDYVLY